MKELFNISPHSTGDGFTMDLKTGVVDVPDENGGYIISTSMGAGKTESIKSLIRQKYNDGILYCVDTKEELKKMYCWIIDGLVNDNNCGLKYDDVMIVSSDKDFQYQLSLYRDNPEMLMYKKVILITHVRFWTDLINYFLVYNPDKKEEVRPFNGDFAKLMTRNDLRRYVVFDETPTFIKPFVEFDRSILGVFSKIDGEGKITCMDKDGISAFYERFIRNTKLDFFNDTYKINRIKRDVVLGLVPKYYDSWMVDEGQKVGITFNPVDICPDNVAIKTHVLIFEGAGNILFKGSSCFKLLDVKEKYNTVTEFKQVEFGLKRNRLDNDKFSSFLDGIVKLIDKPSLVVCWKDVNGNDEGPGISSYAERVRNGLLERKVNPEMFSVTYYGASDNKSTNQYRDMRQIILCGDWSLPNTEAAKIRKAYGTKADSQDLKMWYFAQLITRIGIRKHIKGEVYTVLYTCDFEECFIDRLDSYFNKNRLIPISPVIHEDWKVKLEGMKIRSNIKSEIITLAGSDDKMQEAIVQGKEFKKEVTFDFLDMLGIRRILHEKQRYNTLVETLKKIGITLVILSSRDIVAG